MAPLIPLYSFDFNLYFQYKRHCNYDICLCISDVSVAEHFHTQVAGLAVQGVQLLLEGPLFIIWAGDD